MPHRAAHSRCIWPTRTSGRKTSNGCAARSDSTGRCGSRYWSWLAEFLRGDWGYSFSDGRPVVSRVLERLPATIELMGVSIACAMALTLPVGVWSAVRRGRWFDRLTTTGSMIGISLPGFWFGLLLQMIFAIGLGWLPSSGRGTPGVDDLASHLQHLVMPTVVLAFVLAAGWSRYLRGSMIETIHQPFILAAGARGVPFWRRDPPSCLTQRAGSADCHRQLDAALLVSGAVVTESVFAWPGLGSLFTEALARRDYTVLMALLMLSSAAVVVFNVVADVLHRDARPARDTVMRLPAIVLASLIAAAIAAPWLAPYAPDAHRPVGATQRAICDALVRHRRART